MDSKIQIINVFNQKQDSYNENELNLIPFEPLNRAENITKINDVFNVGDENQLLSISNNQIKAKSILKFYQVVDNADDLNTCKNNKVSLKSIFDTWYRFTHNANQQNLPANQNVRDGWTFNESTQEIRSNINWGGVMGFISQDKLDKWDMKLKITSQAGDDDGICVVVGFTTDNKGIEHTLMVMRSGGKGVTKDLWFLVYDYAMATENRLVLNGSKVNGTNTWTNNFAHIYVKRDGNSILAKTTNINSDSFVESANIIYTLPETRPSEMPEEQYNNMKEMLSKPSKLGFGCSSQNGIFTLEQQTFIKDSLIYDLQNNQILDFKNNKWTSIGTPDIEDNILIFNRTTKKLFYYNQSILVDLSV